MFNSSSILNNTKDISDIFFETLYTKKSHEWKKIGEKKLVSVFKETYKNVPAYKKFITYHTIDSKKISSYKSFDVIPHCTKKNYLRAYPWQDLCKLKSLDSQSLVMTSTSGSTGEPFYFPRTSSIDVQSSLYHEMFLRSSKIAKNKSTLVIDCFGMGVWIGGLITYQAFKYIAERGYALTIVTPGINKNEIFQVIKNLGKKYDQIILCGYPPFIKDIIDEAEGHNIILSDYIIKIIFAAEGFSETFREYVAKKIGIKNIYRDMMNIYGSADLGTMAQETPVSVLIRRLALENQILYMRLFGQATRLPTLTQYIPECINFESKKNTILCTGDNVLPLVRYEIGDNGGVFSYQEMVEMCQQVGVDILAEIKKADILDTVSELPFVYVYERSDFSASFYGAIIYPEFIKKGLADELLSPFITGKFTMYTMNDEYQNQYLEINIEMKNKQNLTSRTKSRILKSIHSALFSQSAEYKKISESLGDKAFPKLVFWSYGHATHFLSGAKQKWVKKIVK